MDNQNSSDVGKNISDVVQQAIDSQDFSKLSDTIQKTVSTAVTSTANTAVKGINKGMNAVGDSINQMADYVHGKKEPLQKAQDPWKGNGEFERKTNTYMMAKDIPQTGLYSIGHTTRLGAWALVLVGAIGTVSIGIGVAATLIAFLTGESSAFAPFLFTLVCALPFAYMWYSGRATLGRLERFGSYVRMLGNRTSISMKELSTHNEKGEAYTLKDVKDMLRRGMFRQGHLDEKGETLFVSHESYDAYTKNKQIEQEKQAIAETAKQQEAQKAQQAQDALPDDVKQMIAEGQTYVDQIKKANEAIQDEEVSKKLDGLETVTTKIFKYVEEHPDSASETKKLMKYYLPTTIKLLNSYQQLNDHPVEGQNTDASKKQIEDTLDTLNQAFARLFDNLYQDTSMDINADISVLNTLLAQEGLTGQKM